MLNAFIQTPSNKHAFKLARQTACKHSFLPFFLQTCPCFFLSCLLVSGLWFCLSCSLSCARSSVRSCGLSLLDYLLVFCRVWLTYGVKRRFAQHLRPHCVVFPVPGKPSLASWWSEVEGQTRQPKVAQVHSARTGAHPYPPAFTFRRPLIEILHVMAVNHFPR